MAPFFRSVLFLLGLQGLVWASVGLGCPELAKLTADGKSYTSAQPLNREHEIARLRSDGPFEVLVVGGGASGLGAGLDAATRGLKVAVVDRDDFAAETSSRSTKLLHGGVRYLEMAVKQMLRGRVKESWQNLRLVYEALHERDRLLDNAQYLSRPLPLVTPIYTYWEIPYFWTGLKVYDRLAGSKKVPSSRFISKKEISERFPHLNQEGLKGGVEYFDGQFNDSRMAMAIAASAHEQGATVANHVELVSLVKENGQVVGAKLRDRLTGESWETRAKVVINATGPFSDKVRQMDDPNAKPLMKPSSGTHLVLDGKYVPPDRGILIPKTPDGRVVFILPWEGHTIVGTTDNPAAPKVNPKPGAGDVDYILETVAPYFATPPGRSDVKSEWTGLRPLVLDPNAKDTSQLSRDHVVMDSGTGLVTLAGGKWTTFRTMGRHVVDEAVRTGGLEPLRPSQTDNLLLAGQETYSLELPSSLQKKYDLTREQANHLASTYGGRSDLVGKLIQEGFEGPLVAGHPILQAEVVHAIRNESARSVMDILARRTRLAFVDAEAAQLAVPLVAAHLQRELGWSVQKRTAEIKKAQEYFSAAE